MEITSHCLDRHRFAGRGIAKLSSRQDPGGCIVTILLGIAGALLAGFLGRAVGWYGPNDAGAGFVAAVIGAVLLLLIYRLVVRRRS